MASKEERAKRAQSNYDKLDKKRKSKLFAGTITRERRGKGPSTRALEDRLEQEKLLKREAGLIRKKK